MKESDLYLPVKAFLETQGYEVKSEIHNCDVVAVRGEEPPVIVELKLSFNLSVILQSVDRLALSSKVYIAVPKQCKSLNNQYKRILKLLKMLAIGLLVVDSRNNVKTLLDPAEYKPREVGRKKERLLGEFAKRVGDPNLGGVNKRTGTITAYRQQAVSIAQYLSEKGSVKASDIAKTLGIEKARDILYRDVYGWFDREGKGIYRLSPRGENELDDWVKRLAESDNNTSEKANKIRELPLE